MFYPILARCATTNRATGRTGISLFKQIILNLLSNGVKFTTSRGQIIIGSGVNGQGDLVISIKDTGIGIPSEHLERVLNPFEQVADQLTKENEGTGLGLPIARALIELHGGSLTLSSALAVGTTVALRLPQERVAAELPQRLEQHFRVRWR